MIELPEALNYAELLKKYAVGRKVSAVYPPSAPHKFCWFQGDVEKYREILADRTVRDAMGFGIYVEIIFDGGVKVDFNDGVNVRLLAGGKARPEKYQLLVEFTDGSCLVFTVAMYGGIICHEGGYDNEYYIKSKESVSPLSSQFDYAYFEQLISQVKPAVSVKALLATEQRIPGLGNGVLQDILFRAHIHPKRKAGTLTDTEKRRLCENIKEVLRDMTVLGGRDTEKNLLGETGGYHTILSRNTLSKDCPCCGGGIVKETYLGGAVYYCPVCQPAEGAR